MTRKWSLEKFLRKIASKVLKKVKFWNQSERGRGDPLCCDANGCKITSSLVFVVNDG